jgi:hypothetical protein
MGFLLERKLGRVAKVGAVGFVDSKVGFLDVCESGGDVGKEWLGPTYIYNEALAPPLLLPWELVLLFKFDQKLALKVKELVESREKVVNCILIDYILLHERAGVVLVDSEERH